MQVRIGGVLMTLSLMSQTISGYTVQFSEEAAQGERKTFMQNSSQPQRDRPLQDVYSRRYTEPEGYPFLRSGTTGLDALFALAMTETRELSVESIRDGAFQNGQAVRCSCFETGELWHYVWTRDASYAVDLGLGWIDPKRSQNTLLFKLSAARQTSPLGSGPEIVQDTGSGGSWPISTDRVVWALGADRLLQLGADAGFFEKVYEGLRATIETDRLVVFDRELGLYRGEQSFLDWREQSYPSWTQNDVKAIGMSFALSTNVLHLMALRKAASYAASVGEQDNAQRYQSWATALSLRIKAFFWLPDNGLFASMSSATDPVFPLKKYDLLGQSLAVLAGLTTAEEGQRIFSQYPVYQAGPPVIHPQLPVVDIYHNRAVWPFVTAYAMKAAAAAGHAAFVTAAMSSLYAGAALNLSHMENLEFTTGLPTGTAVNSRRQLWSVAGFASLVFDGIFGLQATAEGLTVHPQFTQAIARQWMPGRSVELRDLQWQGKAWRIRLSWDAFDAKGDGFFAVKSQTTTGTSIEVKLQALPSTSLSLNRPNYSYITAFAPMEPRLSFVDDQTLRVDRHEMNPTTWDLYRNGLRIAANLNGDTYRDEAIAGACYTAIQTYRDSPLSSHPSVTLCRNPQVQSIEFFSLDGASEASDHGRRHFNDWGRPQQVLQSASFQVQSNGRYAIEVEYGNAFGPINTGITAAVKWIELVNSTDGTVQGAPIVMPQQINWDVWATSLRIYEELKAGHRYHLRLVDGKNMSYLQHFDIYTGGAGGAAGISNRANIGKAFLLEKTVYANP